MTWHSKTSNQAQNVPGYHPSPPDTCGEWRPMGFRSGVEATFVARVRLPPGAINRAATPLRKCVGERGLLPCNNSADGRVGDQLRTKSHYDIDHVYASQEGQGRIDRYHLPPA